MVATKDFQRKEFVCEYAGEFLDLKEAKKRERVYKQDQSVGCFMYYFDFKDKKYW